MDRRLKVLSAAGAAIALAVIFASAALAARTFGDGTHRVGKDIAAGTYRAPKVSGGLGGCYWARLRNFSGGLNSIIANDNASGPAVVTIKGSDRGFESNDCGTWTSNLARVSKSRTRIAAGTWIVGIDVAPGTYLSRAGSSCYWARLRAFTGDLNSIIANDNPRGRAIVTISRSDKGFDTNGCGTWTR